jgi:hypothetical protein
MFLFFIGLLIGILITVKYLALKRVCCRRNSTNYDDRDWYDM